MFSRLAEIVDHPHVKAVLVALSLVPTAILGYYAVLGALGGTLLLLITQPFGGAFLVAFLGFGAIWGLAAAWLRIILSRETFSRSTVYWPTVLGLIAGIAVWTTLMVGGPTGLRLPDPVFFALLTVGPLGAVLLGATVGARALRSG